MYQMDIFEVCFMLSDIQSYHFYLWNLWFIIVTSSIINFPSVIKKLKSYFSQKLWFLSINRRFHDVSEDRTQVHECLIFHRTLSEVRKITMGSKWSKLFFLEPVYEKGRIFRWSESEEGNGGPWMFLFWLSADNTWQSLSSFPDSYIS